MKHSLTCLLVCVVVSPAAVPAEAQYLLEAYPAPPVPAEEPHPLDQRHVLHAYLGGELFGLAAAYQTTSYASGYLGRFGGGIGLFAGLRLNPYLSVEGNWTFSLHDQAWDEAHGAGVRLDSIYITGFTADLKVHLPSHRIVEPYAQAGAGFVLAGAIVLDDRHADSENSVLAKGLIFNVGGGLDIWISRHVSMGGRVLYRGLALGEPEIETMAIKAGNFVSGVSVDVMATLHF